LEFFKDILFSKLQVEAALIAEPDNEELIKLKEDLNEIIVLQQELVTNTPSEVLTTSSSSLSNKERLVWKVSNLKIFKN